MQTESDTEGLDQQMKILTRGNQKTACAIIAATQIIINRHMPIKSEKDWEAWEKATENLAQLLIMVGSDQDFKATTEAIFCYERNDDE